MIKLFNQSIGRLRLTKTKISISGLAASAAVGRPGCLAGRMSASISQKRLSALALALALAAGAGSHRAAAQTTLNSASARSTSSAAASPSQGGRIETLSGPIGPGTRTPPNSVTGEAQADVNVLRVPDQYSTIQAAVDAAQPNDIIHVASGIYAENVVITTSGLQLRGVRGAVIDGTGLSGIGIQVRGTSVATPVTAVEVSGFEVRSFERGIIVQWAVNAGVHHNEVHQNVDKTPPLALGDATGIELITTHFSEVSENFVHDNGEGGIQLRVGSTQNTIRANSVYGNGTQHTTDLGGRGILLTGLGTDDNLVLQNEVIGNYGQGILLARPLGTAPITGNLVAQNRAHDNQRSGIAIMAAAIDNFVLQNDARTNNISGLAPCYRCNLVDLSIGTNVWARNLGTFNITDTCAP